MLQTRDETGLVAKAEAATKLRPCFRKISSLSKLRGFASVFTNNVHYNVHYLTLSVSSCQFCASFSLAINEVFFVSISGLHTLPSYLDMSDEVKEQLADAATHTTRAYAVVRRSRQPDADTEHGKTAASSENRSVVSARLPGFNGGSSVALNEILLVKPIMRILQLLCENHNHSLQVRNELKRRCAD